MNKRVEFYFLTGLGIIAGITSISTIVGFFYNSQTLIIESSRWLSFSVLLLLTKLGEMIYRDVVSVRKEVEVTIKTKEDIEAFRKQINDEIEKMVKQIEEEEKQ